MSDEQKPAIDAEAIIEMINAQPADKNTMSIEVSFGDPTAESPLVHAVFERANLSNEAAKMIWNVIAMAFAGKLEIPCIHICYPSTGDVSPFEGQEQFLAKDAEGNIHVSDTPMAPPPGTHLN